MSASPGTPCCFHCSEPLPTANPGAFSTVIDHETRRFCCPACQSVAETIHTLGLAAYYSQRDRKPQHAAATVKNLSEMDLPAIQAAFVRTGTDGLAEADLFLPEIHCASCCWLIEHHLQSLDGVEKVNALLSQQKVQIRWRPNQLRTSALFAALANIGYRAVPWHDTAWQTHNNTQQKQLLKRTGVAGIVAVQIHMIAMGNYFGVGEDMALSHQQLMNGFALLLSLPVWFYSAQPFFSSAWRHLRSGILGMDLPVTIAIITAAIVSILGLLKNTNEVYFDSIAMFVFLLLGARYLEVHARNRLSIHAQAPALPQTCTRLEQEKQSTIATQDLVIGDVIVAGSGDTIAADGIVIGGEAAVEQALITGEFLPVNRKTGDTVLAGTVLRSGNLHIQVKHWGKDSQIARLQQQVETALDNKESTTPYDTLTRYFTPSVLLIAAASGIFWLYHDPAKAVMAVLAVLVASCPCALSLAIPSAQTAATLMLRRRGILVTRQNVLLSLPQVRCFVFDKTGTLTTGRFEILHTDTLQDIPSDECLAIASALETGSTHPIATAFINSRPTKGNPLTVTGYREYAHKGIEGIINGQCYRLGSAQWCQSTPTEQGQTQVILANPSANLARFTLGDSLRQDAPSCVKLLQAQGINCAILSGDSSQHVADVATTLSIHNVHNACSPSDKVHHLQDFRKHYGCVAMLGDGINDGPVLAQADLSLSLADASQTARLAADVLLLNNRLSDIAILFSTAKRFRCIAQQNVAWAFFYNISILPVAAASLLPPAAAATGMALSSLLVTLNALRLFTPATLENDPLREA